MNQTIHPKALSGTVAAIPSKSQAHRLMICASFADRGTFLTCPETNRDIEATADCLRSLGAVITRKENGYLVQPASRIPEKAELNCCESGSTLRFLLPVVGALGVDGTFLLSGRLPQRPLSPLWEEMERMGCRLSRPTRETLINSSAAGQRVFPAGNADWKRGNTQSIPPFSTPFSDEKSLAASTCRFNQSFPGNTVRCQGKLRPGSYRIDGGISSQFVSGLLFALALLDGESTLEITGSIESRPYIAMTERALSLFQSEKGRPFHSPGNIAVEGDWSNGAFFLAAKALGNDVTVTGLDDDSPQGDRAAAELLPRLLAECPIIDARDIPDLVPILSVVAAASHGCRFEGIQRLRLKESDRVASVIAMLTSLGGRAEADETSLTVFGGGLRGGTVDAFGDHRIAMSAAIAATVCKDDVTVLGADAVNKSYPLFWSEYARLGGNL